VSEDDRELFRRSEEMSVCPKNFPEERMKRLDSYARAFVDRDLVLYRIGDTGDRNAAERL